MGICTCATPCLVSRKRKSSGLHLGIRFRGENVWLFEVRQKGRI